MTARNWTLAPSVSWHELGHAPLTDRGRRRLTMAVTELASIEHAIDKIVKKSAGDTAIEITADEAMLAREVDLIYREREGLAIEPGTDSYPDDVDELNAMDTAQDGDA